MGYKFDSQVENFNRFTDLELSQLTPTQLDHLPPEVLNAYFRKGRIVSSEKIPFLAQLYMLYMAKNKTVYLVVEDPDNGLSLDDMKKFKDDFKNRESTIEQSEYYLSKGCFVISNREMAEYINHVNTVSVSFAMNYALKIKNTKSTKLPDLRTEFLFLTKLFTAYESSKKKILKRYGLTVCEFYVLCYLADEKEKACRPCYREIFKDAILSSRPLILAAFKNLNQLNYIVSFGTQRNRMYRITPLGKNLLMEVFKKYIIP